MAKVIVSFTGAWRGYGKGEVAGFEEDVAQSLIDGGRAELYESKKAGKGGAKAKSTPASKEPPQPGPSTEVVPPEAPNGSDTDDDEAKP